MAENVTLYTKDSAGNKTPLNPSTIAAQVVMEQEGGGASSVEAEISALRTAATPESKGLMSAADKAKLDGLICDIKTALDEIAVPGTLYVLGEQAEVSFSLPDGAYAGQMVSVVFYSPAASPTALTVTGSGHPFNFAPAGNARIELSCLHDGSGWSVLWAEQATEAESEAAGENVEDTA